MGDMGGDIRAEGGGGGGGGHGGLVLLQTNIREC